jgi:hypothetical protein
MDKKHISHDILNLLERLRIMHDILKDKKFDHIPKDEVMVDLKEALKLLDQRFIDLANTDQ